MLLGRGNELAWADRALLGMGPPCKRFRPPDPMPFEVQLRLVGNPNLAIVDRLIELAEQGQPPVGVLQPLGVMIFPAQAFRRGLVSRDEGATFTPWQPAGFGTSVAALIEAADGAIIAVGEAGATRLTLPAP